MNAQHITLRFDAGGRHHELNLILPLDATDAEMRDAVTEALALHAEGRVGQGRLVELTDGSMTLLHTVT